MSQSDLLGDAGRQAFQDTAKNREEDQAKPDTGALEDQMGNSSPFAAYVGDRSGQKGRDR